MQDNQTVSAKCPGISIRKDSTELPFSLLPPEILHEIFRHLDIIDILRLRRVSRFLNGITHYRDIWSDAYRRADCVCSPGPYFSQSAHDLEHALIHSFRTSQNLRNRKDGVGTTNPLSAGAHAIKSRSIRYTGEDLCVSLVFGGRFLLIALSEEVRCFDLSLEAYDNDSDAKIIYRPTNGSLTVFKCVTAIDLEGRPFACTVLTEKMTTGQDGMQTSIYSLNVIEQSKVTFDLLHQFEHPMFYIDRVDLGPRVIVIQGRASPNADVNQDLVAFDVHTRTHLVIPPFIHLTWGPTELPQAAKEETSPLTCISTSTHLLLARSTYTEAAAWRTFVQAFELPPQASHSRSDTHRHSVPLCPSHRGILLGIHVGHTALLHDATTDPSTHDVFITLRVQEFRHSLPHRHLSHYGISTTSSKYGVLRLGYAQAPQADSTGKEEVCLGLGTVTLEILGRFGPPRTRPPILHPSFNGVGRVFFKHPRRAQKSRWVLGALEYDVHQAVRQGGHNDSDKSSVGQITNHAYVLHVLDGYALADYDPYSGRLCFRGSVAEYNVVEIWDLAVWAVGMHQVHTDERNE